MGLGNVRGEGRRRGENVSRAWERREGGMAGKFWALGFRIVLAGLPKFKTERLLADCL
jgi:hypothetical protein